MSILNIATVYYYTRIGQQLQDEVKLSNFHWEQPIQLIILQTEEFYRDLCECPWFLWNKSNKMLYLMFLMHAREPLIFNGIGVNLNYTVVVQVGNQLFRCKNQMKKKISENL